MKTTLVRKALSVANLGLLTEEKMLSDVRAILGYKVADNAMQLHKLAALLKELDIEPFDSARVETYKKEEAKALTGKRRTYWRYGSHHVTQSRGVWKSTLLQKYFNEVPAFALIRAAQLKKAMNLANIPGEFYVEELVRRSRTIEVFRDDPFMVLHSCGKKLYIDVWNEPKFEGRRTR